MPAVAGNTPPEDGKRNRKKSAKLLSIEKRKKAEALLAEPAAKQVRVRVEKPQALAPHALAAGVELTLAR